MLDPEKIKQFDQVTGLTTSSSDKSAGLKRADEIRRLASESQNNIDTASSEDSGGLMKSTGRAITETGKGFAKEIGGTIQGLGKLPMYAVGKGVELLTGNKTLKDSAIKSGISSDTLESKNAWQSFGKGIGFGVELLTPGFAPEAIVSKVGMSGLIKAGEKGLLTPEIFNTIKNAVTSKFGQKAIQLLSDFVQGSTVTTASELGAGNEPDINTVVGGGFMSALGGQVVRKAGSKILPKSESEVFNSRLKDVTPDYNPKLISEPVITTPEGKTIPRVTKSGNLLKSDKVVNPTNLEKEAAQELSKVPNYPENGTYLEKYNSIQPAISSKGDTLLKSLENEKIARPPEDIISLVKKSINQTSEDSLILQKSDPTIKQYIRVLENAVEANDGTLAGELKVRQTLDAAYKNARGKMAFGDSKISALDEIHESARDALNKDIIDNAKSTNVKKLLKEQWDLYRASSSLLKKAEDEGASKIERLMQKYPVTSKIIEKAGKASGVGAGIKLIK